MKKYILILLVALISIGKIQGQEMPTISSEDNSNETWYTIRFVNGNGGIVQDMGDDAALQTRLPNGESSQQWKLVQAKDTDGNPIESQYVLIGKSGRKINFNGSNFTGSSSASVNITLDYHYDSYYLKDIMIITRVGGQSMHQPNGGEIGGQLMEFGAYEWANPVVFGPVVPAVSTSTYEYWYYMQFSPGIDFDNKVVTYKDENTNLKQETYADGNNNQLWKVVSAGTEGNFVIENKNGAKMTFVGDRYQASKTDAPCEVNFNVTLSGIDWWAMKRKDASGEFKWMNAIWIDEAPAEVGEWDQHGAGSAMKFVFVSENATGSSSIINPEASKDKADISVAGNAVKVIGKDLRNISIYTVTSQKVASGVDKSEFVLPNKGYYIVFVEYNDGSSEAKKVMVK